MVSARGRAAAAALVILIGSALVASAEDRASSGYHLEEGGLLFFYRGSTEPQQAYVAGNFNGWTKDDPAWKMTCTGTDCALEVDASRVGSEGGFYEFTFRIDGELVDADSRFPHTIHCAGYGYRHTIPELGQR